MKPPRKFDPERMELDLRTLAACEHYRDPGARCIPCMAILNKYRS